MRYLLLTLLIVQSLCTLPLYGQGGGAVYYDMDGSENISGDHQAEPESDSYLLTIPLGAYRSVFPSISDFNFSFTRYVPRGYEHSMRRVYFDGIDMGDRLNGTVFWNPMSAMVGVESVRTYGITPSGGMPGGAGEIESYNVSAGLREPGNRVSLMATDRRFNAGARLYLNSGWMSNGWAYSVAGSRRFGTDRHIKGVFSDDWSASVSVAKKLNASNWISVSAFMSPTQRGVRGAATGEAFELYGSNFYNPYWGYQNGDVRSSRVREERMPMVMATWKHAPSQKFDLTTTFSYMAGRSSYSSLDWYSAENPVPDYYRYMPSFISNSAVGDYVAGKWRERDPSVTQINWAELYYANRNGTGTVPASYVLSSSVTDYSNFQAVSALKYDIDATLRLNGGVRVRIEKQMNYKRLDDLFGAVYIEDIDQYLIDDQYYGDKLLNNMRDPGRKVYEKDKFGYNYDMNYNSYGGWAMLDVGSRYGSGRLSGFAGLEVNQVSIQREGHYEKEIYEGNASYGTLGKLNFTEYDLKAGIRYIPVPAHNLTLTVLYADKAPSASEIFLSPRYQNAVAGEPRMTNIISGEFGYRFSRSGFEVTVTGYVTRTTGQNEVKHFYDDVSTEYSNAVMHDVKKLYSGVELGIGIDLTNRLALNLAAAKMYNVYLNDPMVDIYSDKSGQAVALTQQSYIKAYRLSGTPQLVSSAELRYSGQKMWNASLALNYAADNHISLNPMRRMKRVFNRITAPELLDAILDQERFPDAMTVNLFLSKTFRVSGGYLSLTGSVNNIANRTNIVYSGYEQMRVLKAGTGTDQSFSPFASKYNYGYGRTYYVTVNYRF